VKSFEKFHLGDVQKVVDDTLCDYSFKITAIRSDKGWILRLYPKMDKDGNVVRDRPQFERFVSFGVPTRMQSRAHLELFSKLYPEIRKVFTENEAFGDGHLDSLTTVHLVKYGTSHANIMPGMDEQDYVKSKNLQVIWEDGDEL